MTANDHGKSAVLTASSLDFRYRVATIGCLASGRMIGCLATPLGANGGRGGNGDWDRFSAEDDVDSVRSHVRGGGAIS